MGRPRFSYATGSAARQARVLMPLFILSETPRNLGSSEMARGLPMTGHFAALLTGSCFAALVFLGLPGAGADESGNPTTRQSFQSRIDQLAQPAAPQTAGRPYEPPANGGAGPGSFPRSFLIPGTNTSIRIGGSVGGAMGYYGH
jgi:hypothetical protein